MSINMIYLGRIEVEDRWIWPVAKGGTVMPKLVYRKLREEARDGGTDPGQGRSAREESPWTELWRSLSTPKVKSFLWQAGHQVITVYKTLARRGIGVTTRCPFYTNEEYVEHALLGNAWVRRAWLGGMDMRWDRLAETDMESWLKYIMWMEDGATPDGEKKRFRAEILMWEIWKERC